MFNTSYQALRLRNAASQLEDAKTEEEVGNALMHLHTVQKEIFTLGEIHKVWSN